jgi:hypothetical protein
MNGITNTRIPTDNSKFQAIKGAAQQKYAFPTTHRFKFKNPLPLFGEALANPT